MPRNQSIKIYTTLPEYERFVQRAAASGLSVSSWARMVLIRESEVGTIPNVATEEVQRKESATARIPTPRRKKRER